MNKKDPILLRSFSVKCSNYLETKLPREKNERERSNSFSVKCSSYLETKLPHARDILKELNFK